MKYLLCRPFGGLNDSLCQIMNCYNYCYKYDRCLLIDTKYNNFMNSSFSDYFTFTDNIKIPIIYNYDEIYNLVNNNNFSTFPTFLKDKLFSYKWRWCKGNYALGHVIDEDLYINAELNKIYDEDIILYNRDGGGISSFELLKLIKINKYIIDEFKLRYEKIPKPYISIHIRNTDYKLDYEKFYNDNKLIIDNNTIFLATDSNLTLDFFNKLNIKIFSFIKVLNDKNIPLHHLHDNSKQLMIDTLCDLVMLALGDKFILPPNCYGFTNLAKQLFNNKDVVNKLISN